MDAGGREGGREGWNDGGMEGGWWMVGGWMDGRMSGWMDAGGREGGRDGQTDGWVKGRMMHMGRMDEQVTHKMPPSGQPGSGPSMHTSHAPR